MEFIDENNGHGACAIQRQLNFSWIKTLGKRVKLVVILIFMRVYVVFHVVWKNRYFISQRECDILQHRRTSREYFIIILSFAL